MNLPIPTSVPRTSATPAASTAQTQDNNQTGDPFASLLASQLAGNVAANGQPSSSSPDATSTDALIAAAHDKKDGKQQSADTTHTPAADMLAAMLAVPATPADAQPTQTETAPAITQKALTGATLPTDPKAAPQLRPEQTATADTQPAAAQNTDNTHNVVNKATNDVDRNFAATLHAQNGSQHVHQPLHQASLPQADARQVAVPMQLAQANPQVANTAVSLPHLTVDTPVGNQNWGSDLGQKITWLSTQNQHSAELQLNPPNLGPLNVVLKVDGSHASAMFTSPHAAVRDAVQQALPQLREMMASNGITLGNATVSDQRPNNQGGQTLQHSRHAGAEGAINGISSSPAQSTSTPTLSVKRHDGLVDTFV